MAMSDFETKTQKALRYYQNNDFKSALEIFKDFDRAFSKEDLRVIQIAYDIFAGFDSFYRQLHYDINYFVTKSLQIIDQRFNIKR